MSTRCEFSVFVPAYITGAKISEKAKEHIESCKVCQGYAKFLKRMGSYYDRGEKLNKEMKDRLGPVVKTKKKK